jgi:DNA-directed RNA polymerase subunit RPC12/RpoP
MCYGFAKEGRLEDGGWMMEVNCPHCRGRIEVELIEHPQLVHCPHCGEGMELAALPADGTIINDLPPEEHKPADDDLDARRITQVAKLRRTAFRSRSWFLIGAVGCLACFGQFVWNAIALAVHPGPSRSFSYLIAAAWVIGAVAAASGVVWMYRRSERFRLEGEKSQLAEPDREPDFTGLSDGGQAWKNLEEMDRT